MSIPFSAFQHMVYDTIQWIMTQLDVQEHWFTKEWKTWIHQGLRPTSSYNFIRKILKKKLQEYCQTLNWLDVSNGNTVYHTPWNVITHQYPYNMRQQSQLSTAPQLLQKQNKNNNAAAATTMREETKHQRNQLNNIIGEWYQSAKGNNQSTICWYHTQDQHAHISDTFTLKNMANTKVSTTRYEPKEHEHSLASTQNIPATIKPQMGISDII